jgi:transposase, IS5 family
MQIFCGALLSDNEIIRDNSFVSSVRGFLGGCVNFEAFQLKIIENWKEEIPDKNVLLEDATCYEVYIRFPTDVKLL